MIDAEYIKKDLYFISNVEINIFDSFLYKILLNTNELSFDTCKGQY